VGATPARRLWFRRSLSAHVGERARWHPLHFKPAIDTATNEQCLQCHQEILKRQVKEEAPAGVKAAKTLAWYQTLNTYSGDQETFHSRHLTTPYAQQVMELKCNFCHQGNDPREEAPIPPEPEAGFTLRKMVDPKETCSRCHGRHNYEIMGLPGPWPETREMMNDSCLTCHSTIRTNRHQVTYLKADEIEQLATEGNSDVCYGCHGGRQWYRITYPYPRHPWPTMSKEVPDWAQDRPTQSDARFRLTNTDAEASTETNVEKTPATTDPTDKPATDKPAESTPG
jgi:hypothetical protein